MVRGVYIHSTCTHVMYVCTHTNHTYILHVPHVCTYTCTHVHRGTGYTQVYYYQYTGNNITYIIHPGAHECVHTVRRFPHTVCTVHVHLCVKVQENL